MRGIMALLFDRAGFHAFKGGNALIVGYCYCYEITRPEQDLGLNRVKGN